MVIYTSVNIVRRILSWSKNASRIALSDEDMKLRVVVHLLDCVWTSADQGRQVMVRHWPMGMTRSDREVHSSNRYVFLEEQK